MLGGSEARQSRLRSVRRCLAVLGLAGSGLFGFGLSSASADTCILVLCTPVPLPTAGLPLATPTLSLPLPTPTVSLPLATALPTLPLTGTPLPTLSGSPLPTLPGLPLPSPTISNPLPGDAGSGSSPTASASCTVNVLGVCVPNLNSSPPSTPSPGCVLGSGDPACLLSGSSPSGNPTGGGGNNGGGSNAGGTGRPAGSESASPTFSAFGGGVFSGGTTAGGGAAIPLGLSVASIPAVQQLSPVSGLQFGHALILWPLFGLLDLLGLGAVYLVVRRYRATRSD